MGFRSHWYKAIYAFLLKSNLYFSQKFGNKLKMPIFGYVLWPRDLDLCRTWPLLKWVSDLIDIKPCANFHSNLTCTFLKNLVTSQLLTTDDGRRTNLDHKTSPCHKVTGELKSRNFHICEAQQSTINVIDNQTQILWTWKLSLKLFMCKHNINEKFIGYLVIGKTWILSTALIRQWC